MNGEMMLITRDWVLTVNQLRKESQRERGREPK